MRRRRGGLGGIIFSLFMFVVLGGLFLAVLKQFDGDVVAAVSWIGDYIWNLIKQVADKFSNMDGFQQLFKQ